MTATAKPASCKLTARATQYEPVASITTRISVGGTPRVSKRSWKELKPSGLWAKVTARSGGVAAEVQLAAKVVAAISTPANRRYAIGEGFIRHLCSKPMQRSEGSRRHSS